MTPETDAEPTTTTESIACREGLCEVCQVECTHWCHSQLSMWGADAAD